jgi:hypothetical protein
MEEGCVLKAVDEVVLWPRHDLLSEFLGGPDKIFKASKLIVVQNYQLQHKSRRLQLVRVTSVVRELLKEDNWREN